MGDTPRNVLGGDPDLNALLFEAIDRVASPNSRNLLIAQALAHAGENRLPDDILLLMQFVTGPLHATAEGTLGVEAAGALVSDVHPILERVRKIRSSIPPVSAGPSDSMLPLIPDSIPPPAPADEEPRVANTLPPSGLFRETPTSPIPPVSSPYKRGTLPYADMMASSHYVLVVDDDVIFLRGLSRLMRATGLEVLTAPDGGSALRICERARPAIVISDLDMPSPNGLELAHAIAERLGDDAPPFVLLTGAPDPPAESKVVARVLTKSIRPEALLDAIEPFLPKNQSS